MDLTNNIFHPVSGSLSALGIFIIVNSITPGPNNLMLLHGSLKKGFWACRFHLMGISIGLGIMLWLSYWGLAGLIIHQPTIMWIIKILGTIYLLYLSHQMWKTDFTHTNDTNLGKISLPLNFLQAAFFQWLNPKVWTMVIFTPSLAYIPEPLSLPLNNIPLVIMSMILNFCCISVWAIGGNSLKTLFNQHRSMKIIHTIIVLATLYCAIALWQ